MKVQAQELKHRLLAAQDLLALSEPETSTQPTAAELADGVELIFRQHEARYLLEAASEPARIAGSLMAQLNGERAVFMQDAGGWMPILGTVDGKHEQKILRIVADRKTVALVDLSMTEQIGDLVPSREMVAALKSADLPVWNHLLTD